MRAFHLLVSSIVLIANISNARAQDSSRVQDSVSARRKGFSIGLALGPGISVRKFSESVSGTQVSFALAGGLFRGSRLGRTRGGFLPAFKLSLRPAKIDVVNDTASAAPVAQTLKLQPQMLGIGWSAPLTEQLSIRFSAVAGRSFNGISSSAGSRREVRVLQMSNAASVDDNFAWETTARLWHQLTPQTSFIAGASFLHSRPLLHLTTGAMHTLSADQVHFDAGIAFTLYRYERNSGR